jgi:uncharacterized membrane protein YedE/YeeE
MKLLKFLIVGIFFGIALSKGEVVSWFRIYEMFRFDAFHMYGIIGSAVVMGVIIVWFMKRTSMKSIDGELIRFTPKKFSIPRYIFGGTFFGLGWAMVGACPGPMYIILGKGYFAILIVIFGALVGTFVYGLLRSRLPH